MEQSVALVAVENVAYHFDIFYSYTIPDYLKSKVKEGMRVLVPFGRSKVAKRQGVVFGFAEKQDSIRYKDIISVLDDEPFFSKENLELAEFLKDRTFCTYFEGIRVQFPAGYGFKTDVKYFAVATKKAQDLSDTEKQVYDYMLTLDDYAEKGQVYNSLGLDKDCGIIEKLVIKSYTADKAMDDASIKTALAVMSREDAENIKLTPKQESVMNLLWDMGQLSIKEICYFTGVTAAVVNTLSKKGCIQTKDVTVYRTPETQLIDKKADKHIALTDAQKTAYDNLIKKYRSGGGVSLLYGITGSGKTSVFLSLIDEVIKDGRQVIVMVPEISLTPQMMAIFKGRYGSDIAIFHSALSQGERRDEYKRVRDGKVKIVVGTRSAVFAPFDNIGLIVIDEEQEHTYKSESSPKYHTKDVARFRAGKHKALLLLSSATPSMESYAAAKRGKYDLEVLSERYGDAVLPDVSVVDMKAERQAGNKYNLSSELLERLEKNLEDKKQSILLINRRGYNTFVACDSCGSVVNCPSCSISLTYHSANNRLMCHYCGYSEDLRTECPECGEKSVRYSGFGTQKIEDEINPEKKKMKISPYIWKFKDENYV